MKSMPSRPLSEDERREISRRYSYDPVTGHLIGLCRKPHHPVGSRQSDGYLRVVFSGRSYLVHRVAWLLTTGEWPTLNIDHINGDRSDNRWENLRLASHAQNMWNRPAPAGSGTYFCPDGKRKKRWRAAIEVAGTRINLGSFLDRDEATAAYESARTKYHGAFIRTA